MATNRPPFAPSLVFRPSCAPALAALLSCLALMACREQGTNNLDGNSALVASDVASAADQLSNLVEGQRIEVPFAAIARNCTEDYQCMLLLRDDSDESIESFVLGLDAEKFAALKAVLTNSEDGAAALALSGGIAKPKLKFCRSIGPLYKYPEIAIKDFSKVQRKLLCELGNHWEYTLAGERNRGRESLLERNTSGGITYTQRRYRRLVCQSLACKSRD